MTSRASSQVAIVVASFRAPECLAACLRSVAPLAHRYGARIIVARPGGETSAGDSASGVERVQWVDVDGKPDIPRLRGAGLSQSSSELTFLTEDNCVVEPLWIDELTDHVSGADVAGGRMDNQQRARMIDWGAFFAEYGFFAGADPPRAGQLTAANVVYRDTVVSRVAAWMSAGAWENVVHDRLRECGARIAYAPRAVVSQNLTHELRRFCLDRYKHGRDYARTRLVEEGMSRARGLSSTLLLPPLLTYRVARIAGPGRWTTFLRALPATIAFLAAWSAGEASGYLLGAKDLRTGQ